MSDEMYDEDDLAEAYEADPDTLSPEEIFKMVTLNRNKMTKVKVTLRDNEDDEVELVDIITELLAYVKDKFEDESGENQFLNQILPLMAQSVVSGLSRSIGISQTAFLLAQDMTMVALVEMMCLSFLMLKFMQQKELTVFTHEEDVTQEEMDEIDRKSQANNTATLAALMGSDPKAVLQRLKDEGKITAKDLRDMFGGEGEESEDDGKDKSN